MWLFQNRDGGHLDDSKLRKVFARLLTKAGLPKRNPHFLRHSFASLLIAQGESLVYVKEQIGHSSIEVTVDTYGHLIPGANRKAVNQLDDPIRYPDEKKAYGNKMETSGNLGKSEATQAIGKMEPPAGVEPATY